MLNCCVSGEGVSFTDTSRKGVGVGLRNGAEHGSHPARRAHEVPADGTCNVSQHVRKRAENRLKTIRKLTAIPATCGPSMRFPFECRDVALASDVSATTDRL